MTKAFPACVVSLFLLLGCSSDDESSDTQLLTTPDQQASENNGTTVIGTDSLFDLVWDMESYTNSDGEQVPVDETTKYQFLFRSDSREFEAFIGCVNYSDSTYDLMDGFIVFKLGIRNEVECNTDSGFISQGRAINALISGGEGAQSLPLMYTLTDGLLHLDSSDGRRLTFNEVPELLVEQ